MNRQGAKVATVTRQLGNLAHPLGTRQPGTPDCQVAGSPDCLPVACLSRPGRDWRLILLHSGERLASRTEVAAFSTEFLEGQAGTREGEPAAVLSTDVDSVDAASVAGIAREFALPMLPGQLYPVRRPVEELCQDTLDPVGRGAKPVELLQERIHTPVSASHILPQTLPRHA